MATKKHIGFEDIQKRFDTEDACREYLIEQRWPDGFICPMCGCREYYQITTRHKYACKSCRHQASVTAGTVNGQKPFKSENMDMGYISGIEG